MTLEVNDFNKKISIVSTVDCNPTLTNILALELRLEGIRIV